MEKGINSSEKFKISFSNKILVPVGRGSNKKREGRSGVVPGFPQGHFKYFDQRNQQTLVQLVSIALNFTELKSFQVSS